MFVEVLMEARALEGAAWPWSSGSLKCWGHMTLLALSVPVFLLCKMRIEQHLHSVKKVHRDDGKASARDGGGRGTQ